jgi:glycosyltransferase involved in cell wall biosynthesis
MKKSILFVVSNLRTGGILRSLQNFLNCYDSTLLNVDVFALVHEGVYKGELHNCNLLQCNRSLNVSLAPIENQHGWAKIECLVFKMINKITKGRFRQRAFNRVANDLIKEKKYDAVIAFSEGVPTDFVSKMQHINKIGWIHCDYASYLRLNHNRLEKAIYDSLNSVVCVSDYTRNTFLHVFPEMAEKTFYIYNILDDKMMRDMSLQPIEEKLDKDMFTIVSVGRIDPVKRLSAIPEIARKIVDNGCKIHWYIVGPRGANDEYKQLIENIQKHDAGEFVFLLGEKSNPYPYIAQANLLVNTSISEACPYVINEAKILHTPIVCSDFGSAKEFIDFGVNGYYVPIEKMADTIVSLYNDRARLSILRENLLQFEYDNETILKQIYSLF